MRIVKRIDPNSIIVKYIKTPQVGRSFTTIDFQDEYVDALRTAINAVRSGYQKVEVIQRREVLHTHEQLCRAADNLELYATDEDIVEEAHHASRKYEKRSLISLLKSAPHSGALVWASL